MTAPSVVDVSRLMALLEHSPDGLGLIDADGRWVYQSPAGARFLGYPPVEREGRDFAELVHPDDVGRVRAVLARCRAVPGSVETAEFRVRHRAGSWVLLQGIIVNRLDDPDVRGILASYRDVTALRAAEEARRGLEQQLQRAERAEAIGRLAGGVAHEFNNQLGIIMGYSQLALRRGQEPAIRRYLEEIGRAADLAATLTRQLLAFSRRQVLEPRVLDLNAVVEGLRPLLARVIGEDVRLEARLAPDLGRVRADAAQLEQVLVDLAGHARQSMSEGGALVLETANVTLEAPALRQRPWMPAGAYVTLAVSDTGRGMDAATLEHVFDPFAVGDLASGDGLGLATVYGIVKQSGGFIYAYSEPGQGTTFRIYLPCVDPPQERPSPATPAGTVRGETILVVEDEPPLRELAQEVLEAEGYRVLAVATPDEALRVSAAETGTIDLLLTDVVLPGIRGSELARRLKATRPGIAVLLTSGYTDGLLTGQGVLEPGVAFIAKPSPPEALVRKVREVLDAAGRRP